MQTTKEGKTEVSPTPHCDDNIKIPSSSDEQASNFRISKSSPTSEESKSKPEAGRRCPSGRGFLKRKFPFLLRRKGAAQSPQGQAASKSRLCMEATHESPIQAVRKPGTQGENLGFNSDEVSPEGKTGNSLLRKLLCLKAASSKTNKKAGGLEASPLHRASARCGFVAALSRTADPQGESPLRWKPRVETQGPVETSSTTEPEKVDAVNRLGGLCMTKPWRTFRAIITSRAKRGSVLSGNESNHRATIREENLCLSSKPEASPASRAEPQSSIVDVDQRSSPPAFPSSMDDPYRAQEEGGHRTMLYEPQSHRRAEVILEPASELALNETSSLLLSEENSLQENNPALDKASEMEDLQAWVGGLPGGRLAEATAEGKGFRQGEDGYWVEGLAGEDQDLADLAENPGGQGMVMAMRDLGWLNSELLGGSTIRLSGQEVEASARSTPDAQTGEEDAVMVNSSTKTKHANEMALGLKTEKTTSGDSCTCPPPVEQQGNVAILLPCDPFGAYTTEGSGTSFPVFPQEIETTSLEPCCSFLPQGLEQGSPEGPLDLPTLKSSQVVSMVSAGGNCERQGSPTRSQLSSEETCESLMSLGHTGLEGEPDKQLIYMAAVEIVGAAIDAAAEQLAKKEERERAKT